MVTAERDENIVVLAVVEPTITITMSEDVAKTLMQIVRMIGGPPEGQRGHADQIREALEEVDVPIVRQAKNLLGSIDFENA